MLSKNATDEFLKLLECEFKNCEFSADNLGNITITKGKKGRELKLICPFETVKLLISKAEEGKIKFIPNTNISPKAFLGKKVTSDNSVLGVISAEGDFEDELTLENLYIDSDLASVKLCSFTEIVSEIEKREEVYCGTFLSNVVPGYIFINIAKALCDTDKEFSLTFKIAKILTENIFKSEEMPYIITLNSAKEVTDFKCGNGCGVVLKSTETIMDDRIKTLALENGADAQIIISDEKITAFDKMSVRFGGGRYGGFCIPVCETDEGVEKIYLKDVEKTENLLLKTIINI